MTEVVRDGLIPVLGLHAEPGVIAHGHDLFAHVAEERHLPAWFLACLVSAFGLYLFQEVDYKYCFARIFERKRQEGLILYWQIDR